MRSRPTVVVLAAGRRGRNGSRVHGPGVGVGEPGDLRATLQAALASGLPVLAVTTPHDEAEARVALAARDVVVLPDHDETASRDVRHSVSSAVIARADAHGWMLLPAAGAPVRAATLHAVAAGLNHSPVAYAQHLGQPGWPVAFGSELFSELARLTDDAAVRRVMARYPSIGIDVDDPATVDAMAAGDLAAWHGHTAAGDLPLGRDARRA